MRNEEAFRKEIAAFISESSKPGKCVFCVHDGKPSCDGMFSCEEGILSWLMAQEPREENARARTKAAREAYGKKKDEEALRCRELRQKGLLMEDIGAEIGLSRSAVSRLLKRAEKLVERKTIESKKEDTLTNE